MHIADVLAQALRQQGNAYPNDFRRRDVGGGHTEGEGQSDQGQKERQIHV